MEEHKEYWLSDIETGYRYKVTKEQHDAYLKMWDQVYPKVDSNRCIPLIYGTAGSMNGMDNSLWFYKAKEVNEENLTNQKTK